MSKEETWSPMLEMMTRLTVAHAKECADFMALPRAVTRRTKYGEVSRCKHCRAALWTADELRKAGKC